MEIAGYLLWIGFRSLKMDFSFSMQISYDAQSVLSALLGNRSDGFGGLCSSQSCPIVHAHFLPLIPLLMLYCLVLINRNYNKDFFSSATLCHLASLLWPHLFLSHGVLISTVLVYYQQSLLDSTAIPVSMFETYALALQCSGNRMLSETYFGLWFIGSLESGLQYALTLYNCKLKESHLGLLSRRSQESGL